MDNDYKRFGLDIIKHLDSTFLFGTGSLSLSFVKLAKAKIKSRKPPLDWNGKNWPSFYKNDDSLLWIMRNGEKIYLPQKVVLAPWERAGELFDTIRVELKDKDFEPAYTNNQCLDFYRKDGDFNGENARLVCYDKTNNVLTFQGANYFDWITTNLSLDYDRHPLTTLRVETAVNGKLHDLDNSPLANITGVNGLLFSNDGYMIYQKRNSKVLVRPNQLCSGFSGTIDKIDVVNLIKSKNPVLSNMDTAREAAEEIGINRNRIKHIELLGITRELIRGGTPEIFYAVDLDLNRNKILDLLPKDKEGIVHSVVFGAYAKSTNHSSASSFDVYTLWNLMEQIENETKAPISIPFLTNLALWYWQWDNSKVGAGNIDREQGKKQFF